MSDHIEFIEKLLSLLDSSVEAEALVAFRKLREYTAKNNVSLRTFRITTQTSKPTDLTELVSDLSDERYQSLLRTISIYEQEDKRLRGYCESLENENSKLRSEVARGKKGKPKQQKPRQPKLKRPDATNHP